MQWLEKMSKGRRVYKQKGYALMVLYYGSQANIIIDRTLCDNIYSDYILFGVDENRLYFKNATQDQGFRVYSSNVMCDNTVRIRCTHSELKNFIGKYSKLYYDKENNYYYVDKCDLIEEEK